MNSKFAEHIAKGLKKKAYSPGELKEGQIIGQRAEGERATNQPAVVKCFDENSVFLRMLDQDGKERPGERIVEYDWDEIAEIYG